jgi:hypothetical protein
MAVAGDEVLVQVAGSILEGGYAFEAQTCHQAMLEAAVAAFGPASGLREISKDKLDAQLLHGPLEMSGLVIPLGHHGARRGGWW